MSSMLFEIYFCKKYLQRSWCNMNIYLVPPFQVGSSEGFAPWLENAEKRVQETNIDERPKTFDEALKFEEKACLFLKEIVKGKEYLKLKYYLCK